MLIKKYTIQTKYGSSLIDHPPEDACLISEKYPIGIVADGITILERKPNGTYPVFSDGQSGPKKISDLFCQTALDFLEKRYPSITTQIIRTAFEKGNKEVKKANQDLLKIKPDNPNYGAETFAAVATLGCLIKNSLIYGFLTDCGLAVVNKKAKLKFLTEEIWPRIEKPADKHLQGILKKGSRGGWRNYRNYVRNNPELAVQGKFYSHGAINGQEGMIKYLEVGQKKLEVKDTVIIFTDGFRNYFQHKEFLEILAENNLNEFEKKLDFLGFKLLRKNPASEYGAERTLILLRR